MRLSQTGSHTAFSVLVERHALRVVRLCSRLAADGQVGEELAQDVWATVWQRREQYQPGSNFVGWLVTVALNRSRNHLRRSNLATRHQTAARLEADATSEQVDTALASERRQRVQRALADLPPAMREALLLRFGEDLRYDEMSAIVGTGESTLRSRVHHGLKALKDKLELDR